MAAQIVGFFLENWGWAAAAYWALAQIPRHFSRTYRESEWQGYNWEVVAKNRGENFPRTTGFLAGSLLGSWFAPVFVAMGVWKKIWTPDNNL